MSYNFMICILIAFFVNAKMIGREFLSKTFQENESEDEKQQYDDYALSQGKKYFNISHLQSISPLRKDYQKLAQQMIVLSDSNYFLVRDEMHENRYEIYNTQTSKSEGTISAIVHKTQREALGALLSYYFSQSSAPMSLRLKWTKIIPDIGEFCIGMTAGDAENIKDIVFMRNGCFCFLSCPFPRQKYFNKNFDYKRMVKKLDMLLQLDPDSPFEIPKSYSQALPVIEAGKKALDKRLKAEAEADNLRYVAEAKAKKIENEIAHKKLILDLCLPPEWDFKYNNNEFREYLTLSGLDFDSADKTSVLPNVHYRKITLDSIKKKYPKKFKSEVDHPNGFLCSFYDPKTQSNYQIGVAYAANVQSAYYSMAYFRTRFQRNGAQASIQELIKSQVLNQPKLGDFSIAEKKVDLSDPGMVIVLKDLIVIAVYAEKAGQSAIPLVEKFLKQLSENPEKK